MLKELYASSSIALSFYRNLDNAGTPIYYYMGIAKHQLGDKNAAKLFFQRALQLAPFHIGALTNYMILLGELGDLTSAHKIMQIIHRAISCDIVHRAGYLKKQANTGAVTYIQRFGSALNLNIHFHMLFLEGVITQECGQSKFKCVKAPNHNDMETLVNVISHRIATYLEKAGLVQRDMDNTFLDLPMDDEDSLLPLQAASVNYRIAVGPDTGKKVFALQTLPAKDEQHYGQLAQINGFSLHAGVFADSHQTDKLERLCRYISRPALSEQRLSLTDSGKVRYPLKQPYQVGF